MYISKLIENIQKTYKSKRQDIVCLPPLLRAWLLLSVQFDLLFVVLSTIAELLLLLADHLIKYVQG